MGEKRLWMEAALMVPETLLLVATSEGVLASISDACKLLGEDIWGVDDADADAVESPSSTTAGSGSYQRFGFGVLLSTTCGLEHTTGSPLFSTADGEHRYRFGSPFHPTFTGERPEVPYSYTRDDGDEMEIARGDASVAAYDERVHNTLIDAGFDHWANLLASALAPTGPLAGAHREITRLIALHGEAGHVLALCAAPLGLRRDDDEDDDPAWETLGEHRAAFLLNAHDALLSMGSAASASAAAEDFLRWRSPGSPRRSEWGSVARRLVGDTRRDVLEAGLAVERMRAAAAREFFHAWTLLKRAP